MTCELEHIFDAISWEVEGIFGDNVDLVLVGSAARGEFTGYQIDGMVESYSDIELILITNKPLIIRQLLVSKLRARLKLLTVKYFFKTGYEGIDIWAMSPSFFQKQNSVFFAEARVNGKLLKSGLGAFKNSLKKTLVDAVDLREIILHRALNMCFSLKNNKNEDEKLQYSLSRNFLDILTVYCWYEGKSETSYLSRLKNIGLPGGKKLSHKLVDELKLSYHHKLDPKSVCVGDFNDRLDLYWIELARLADYVDIWECKNSINYSGLKIYLQKMIYWFSNRDVVTFRSIFRCQKKLLLSFILASYCRTFNIPLKKGNPKNFGLKHISLISGGVLNLDAVKVISEYHYPYLVRK